MLQPVTYPEDWPELSKDNIFRSQAERLKMAESYKKLPQTTRFHDGLNSTGVFMTASTLSGQDSTGVNDGSKTTTLVTYLADAWNWGADLFCECEVRHITEAEGRPGYIVYFTRHIPGHTRSSDPSPWDLMWVYAKECVFFGAGAVGTTEILLRSKAMGLRMSRQIGKNMSDNGDMIAIG